MAKAKRWAVRAATTGRYYLFDGPEPRRTANGRWAVGHKRTSCVFGLTADEFERIFPICLPPGGGPVEIRFADEA